MANIKNNSGSAVSVGPVSIRAGATAKVERWDVYQHSDIVKALIDAKAIEIVEDPTESDKAERTKGKAKKEADNGVHRADADNV